MERSLWKSTFGGSLWYSLIFSQSYEELRKVQKAVCASRIVGYEPLVFIYSELLHVHRLFQSNYFLRSFNS